VPFNNKLIYFISMKKLLINESVSWGHPDKMADQISDAIVDAYLLGDDNSKVAVETMIKDNIVVLGGEVTSRTTINFNEIIKNVIRGIGYNEDLYLNPDNIKLINLIGEQSVEINSAVDGDELGAGDQGFMTGYASNQTPDYMPLGIYLANEFVNYFIGDWVDEYYVLGPDAKSQVIVLEENGIPVHIDSILISIMHQGSLENVRKKIKNDILYKVLPEFPQYIGNLIDDNTEILINPAGSWKIGGPISDCGITGRKIVVDQYGSYCPVGGGAFAGKDYSKTDRSASYLARYIAKNIVASGLVSNCRVDLSYIIGRSEPVSFSVNSFGEASDVLLEDIIKQIVDMRPIAIKNRFNLHLPNKDGWNYEMTSKMKPFGNSFFPWENVDISYNIKNAYNSVKIKK
jgi:S-adenosylmethionine synthetase